MGNSHYKIKNKNINQSLENRIIPKDNIIIEDNENIKNQINNKNLISNNYEEMEKLFNLKNEYYLCHFKENYIIKIIKNNKLFISNDKGIKIYDLGNMTMDLISKSNLKVMKPFLVLKNKNFVIASKEEKCFYILHKSPCVLLKSTRSLDLSQTRTVILHFSKPPRCFR